MTKLIQNEKGFTLIELIVVVAILGIVTAIAATAGLKGGADTAALNAQTEQLISDLRLLRTQATATQSPGTFNIINSGSYDIQVNTSYEKTDLTRGVQISGSPVGLKVLNFNANGTVTADESGPYLLNLTVDSETKTVEISEQGLVQLAEN